MSVFNRNADSLNSNRANSGGVESDRLREALERLDRGLSSPVRQEVIETTEVQDVLAAARRFLALTETGQRVVVRQNRLGESIIHMEGNPLADAADNLKTGIYYVVPADYLTEEE